MIRVSELLYEVKEGEKTRRILNIEDVTFRDSVINIISGPSGSGKTTLLYALGGILNVTSGSIYYSGTSIYSLNSEQKDKFRMENISMVYQNYNLFSFMNVEENILVPYFIKGIKVDKDIKARVNQLLAAMNLTNVNKKSINALSGGEQQRVAIIRAMISEPRVILCDEPTASLDSGNSEVFMKCLKKLNETTNTMIVIATHDEKVMAYADHHIHMDDGRIISA